VREACERKDIAFLNAIDDAHEQNAGPDVPARIVLHPRYTCQMASAVDCLPDAQVVRLEAKQRGCDIVFGAELRQRLKQITVWDNKPRRCTITPGKFVHYAAISMWQVTKQHTKGQFRLFHVDDPKTDWINAADFQHCVANGYPGLRCFFRLAHMPEEVEDHSEAELMAFASYSVQPAWVEEVLRHWGMQESGTLQLLEFSQFSRVVFNREKAFRDFYAATLRHIWNVPSIGGSVALHIRRGDACGHWMDRVSRVEEYTAGRSRACYSTRLYAEKLALVKLIYKVSDVYLASTDPEVLEDFRMNFTQSFSQFNWHFLDFNREALAQGSDGQWYEFRSKNLTRAIGPGSWADLWHLSHGDVLIGNMASHFTRSAWQLAMGRKARFVPYLSVDGRSPCCDITERCKRAVVGNRTMETCLTSRIESEKFCFAFGVGPKAQEYIDAHSPPKS